MNKGDLITAVATKHNHLPRAQVAQIVETLINTIGSQLKRGDKVQITGFGTFSVTKRKARKGRNPKTGEVIRVPATTLPKFSAGAGLKALVSKAERMT